MRARRGLIAGWVVVALYGAALLVVGILAASEPDADRTVAPETEPAAAFVVAWERSRLATFLTVGTYERRSEVTEATVTSEDVVAQRPPRRLHRQLGGVEGRVDDRLLVCPAAPAESTTEPPPCRLGAPGGLTYAASVAREVAGVRSLVEGDDPLYDVTTTEPGCFELRLQRVDPRAPFGVEASFCFDPATGAPSARRVRHAGGIVEVLVVTEIRTEVRDADLEP
jgi:hypothetical protein